MAYDLLLESGSALLEESGDTLVLESFVAPVVPTGITAGIYDRSDMTTPVVTLAKDFARSFREQVNDLGSGRLSVGIENVAFADLVNGRLVLFTDPLRGTQWLGVIEGQTRHLVSQAEKAGQVAEVSVVGALALLEQAVVYPALGLDARPLPQARFFNFASLELDDSGWVTATEVARQDGTGGLGPAVLRPPNPVDWPDPTAYWIWSRAVTTPTDAGISYFRYHLTLGADTVLRIFASADDGYDLWVDGTPLFKDYDPPNYAWNTAHSADIALTAGDHIIAVQAENFDRGGYSNNVAGLLVSAYEVDGAGVLGSIVFHTDDTWVALDYPADPPGFTVGQVANLLLDEWDARGGPADIVRDFSDSVDADGTAWPITADISSAIGMDYTSFLKQLAEGYCDMAVELIGSDITLRLWVPGGHGSASGVTFTAGLNITQLDVEGHG